ncbi:hypothetical protein M2R48_09715 [Acinetobacter sp. I-MWF]|uniref:hypothetical protein n=1 Tax=Acinetobacter sp. I-MWF TaxID=2940517 RepID=UPI0021C9A149|nr:hypothetical protein [Acinetobacter sp. I-MWF]MCT9978603.1 hypothetical protein [Acinetobacter sp. I-MWF]
MSQKIYSLLQHLIPELNAQQIPQDTEFYSFSKWLNLQHDFLHYIELKKYYDNGIENDFYFNQHNIDAEQLQNEIEVAIAEVFDQYDEDDLSSDDQMDAMQQTEEIIFDQIKLVANQYQLSLLVIYRENPYWILVPTQDEQQLNQIVDAFNDAFNDDGDLNMAVY